MNSNLQKPGEKPHKPGKYTEVGPRGGKVIDGHNATIEPGDNKLPPTSMSGNKWKRV